MAGISVAGQTEDEIIETLNPKVGKYLASEMVVYPNGKSTLKPQEVIRVDIRKTAQRAVQVGYDNPFTLGRRTEVPPEVVVNEEKVAEFLKDQRSALKSDLAPAQIKSVNGALVFEPGKAGRDLNFAQSAYNLINAARSLDNNWSLALYETRPEFTTEQFENIKEEVGRKSQEVLVLTAGQQRFNLTQSEILKFVSPDGSGSNTASFAGDQFSWPQFRSRSTIFSDFSVTKYLSQLSVQLNRDVKNAVLGSEADKVIILEAEVAGKFLDVSSSAENVLRSLDSGENLAELVIRDIQAEIRSDNLAELGLTEKISRGYSNFAGSPTNRRHNVRVGATKFNGYLIRPGAKFSFVEVMGPVEASTGYLPELVIKGNKTTPEYGGGICQVSSTVFRAALNAGLPILERKAHSYPVQYYKPYGVDATIYIPKPDLVFRNDTGKYILVQSKIEGNNLYFDFFGTKSKKVISFAGSESGLGSVPIVEKITPFIYDQGARGRGSFTAVFYRFAVDETGRKLTSKFTSKYDSPDKYPH